MYIIAICECGARLKAKDESAGKRLRCPKCQAFISVPAEALPQSAPDESFPAALSIVTGPLLSHAERVRSKPRRLLPLIGLVLLAGAAGSACLYLALARRPAVPAATLDLAPAIPIAKAPQPDQKAEKARRGADLVSTLLTKADFAYADDWNQIIRLVDIMTDELKKEGQTLTPAEALEGSLRWPMPGYFDRGKQAEFAGYYAIYVTIRIGQKLSHRQTIRALHYLSHGLDLASKQVTGPGFQAAFEAASPGVQLAMVESHEMIRGNNPLAEYYGGLAEQVASAYGLTSREISIPTSLVDAQLQKTSQYAHPDQILLASLRWTPLVESKAQGGDRPKYYQFLQPYLLLRAGGKSHAQACEDLCGGRPDDERPEP